MAQSFADYPIYVLHYTPLVERKRTLSEQLAREGMLTRTKWIEDYDREKVTEWPELELPTNKMTKGIIAVGISHVDALGKVAQSAEGYGLIFEDDAILAEGAASAIKKYCSEVPADWDMIFIGSGCNMHVPFWRRRPGKHIYLKENAQTWWGGDGATRCADSYFVSKKGAKELLSAQAMQRPFRHPPDWALNYAIREKNLKVYWMEPTVVTQGSQSGQYSSAQLSVKAT